MLTVKELKEILKECNDNDYISLGYAGCDMEIECGDTFSNIELQDIELNKNNVNIIFD